jgi:hypothetical protein
MSENLDRDARVDAERLRELAAIGRAAYEEAIADARSFLSSMGYGPAPAPSASGNSSDAAHPA